MVLSSADTALAELVEELCARLERPKRLGLDFPEAEDERVDQLKMSSDQPAAADVRFFDTAKVIDFRQHVLPEFVEQATGFSFREDFGRWTNADIARLIFCSPLPAMLEVHVAMMPWDPNMNQPILVVAGGEAKIVVPVAKETRLYKIGFTCKFPGKMIEFFIPHALSPRHFSGGVSDDPRRLGVGIQSIAIKKSTKISSLTNSLALILQKGDRSLSARRSQAVDEGR